MFNSQLCKLLISIIFTLFIGLSLNAQDLNPTTHYFVDGQLVGNRIIQVGDPTNWVTDLNGLSGQSESSKLTISPTSYQNENDAIHASWKKIEGKGQLSIVGPAVDLSQLEDSVALVMELKINRLSKSEITLGMDCTWPCRSEINVRKQLKKNPRKKWFTFAVPLNCLSLNENTDDFDLTKINAPLILSTDGAMEMSIANVRLGLLPEGDPGCRE